MEQEPQRSVAPLGWSRRIAAWPIVAYRLTLSRFLGGQCRFMPSCSTYGLEAVQQHGAIKGWWMAVGRICRCHPFHPGGYDPVPPVCEPGRSKQTVGLHSSSGKVDSLP